MKPSPVCEVTCIGDQELTRVLFYSVAYDCDTPIYIFNDNWHVGGGTSLAAQLFQSTVFKVHKYVCVKGNIESAYLTAYRGVVHILLDLNRSGLLAVRVAAHPHYERAVKYKNDVIDTLRKMYPVHSPSLPNVINISFTAYSNGRAQVMPRDIDIQFWEDIKQNYNSSVNTKLERLMGSFTPAKGGQLILWHGAPGTGKTFAVRALCHKWSKWCDAYYVIDPEVFFGHAPYMVDLVMAAGSEDSYPNRYPYSDEDLDIDIDRGKDKERWKLFILEDAGELISEDARDKAGQGLSRLLNIVDGLIGQGLRVLVLITTNEPLSSLHPAVARPGRCAADIEFGPLTLTESTLWAKKNNLEVELSEKSYRLTDLYAIKEGFEKAVVNKKISNRVGF